MCFLEASEDRLLASTLMDVPCGKRKASTPTKQSPKKPSDAPLNKKSKTEPVEGVAHKKSATQQAKKGARVVRLQRKGGQVVQSCEVYIGRRWTMGGWNLPQSKWANPYSVRKAGSAAEAVRLYEEEHLSKRLDLMAELGELRGKTLGCWCKKKPSDPCHGDVLVRLVNALPDE